VVKKSYPFWDAFPMAVQRIWDVVTISKNGIVRWAAGGDDPGLAGPIGIAQVTGEVAKVGISPLFEFTALISISLAIMNILPIPALDGGRLLFVAIEWVRRGKRISPQREGLVHLVGFAILLSFIVIISYFDIVRILNGDSLIR
jgi:regulator of sigma E protease